MLEMRRLRDLGKGPRTAESQEAQEQPAPRGGWWESRSQAALVETACSNQGGGEGVMEPSVPTICGAGHSLWAWVLRKTLTNWSTTRGGTQDEMMRWDHTRACCRNRLREPGGWDTGRGWGCRRGWWRPQVQRVPQRKKETLILWKFGGGWWAGDWVKT